LILFFIANQNRYKGKDNNAESAWKNSIPYLSFHEWIINNLEKKKGADFLASLIYKAML